VETELETKPAERTIAEQQRRQWHKESDTDTPQDVARQPYRSREKDSGDAFANSLKTDRGNRKTILKKAASKSSDDSKLNGIFHCVCQRRNQHLQFPAHWPFQWIVHFSSPFRQNLLRFGFLTL
jgi:hypothetical protein